MDKVQCPNCGSFNIEADSSAGALRTIVTLVGFVLFFIPGWLMQTRQNKRDWELFLEGKNTAKCVLCRTQFRVDQVATEDPKGFQNP